MRILITGASGMLGATLVKEWKSKYKVFATSKDAFNCNPPENYKPFNLENDSYEKIMNWAKPEVIIHCAAITDVDFCEENSEKALKVNSESVKKFLKSKIKARLIFISSDAVFPEGSNMSTEIDKVNPINTYGYSKVMGEKYLLQSGNPHLSIRTTIIGKNINSNKESFLEWIIHSIKKRKKIRLFKDSFFTPITIWHFAKELEWILQNKISGVINVAGNESISKYDFGIRVCDALGLDKSLIIESSLDEFNFMAKRVKDQTMSSKYYINNYNRNFISMDDTIKSLKSNFKDNNYA